MPEFCTPVLSAAVPLNPLTHSVLGDVTGGATVAAGTPLPATSGRIRLNPGASGRIVITGTAARAGDMVFVSYQGRRDLAGGFADSPAQRRTSGAEPGAPGNYVINDGEVELALSGSNNGNYLFWHIAGVRP